MGCYATIVEREKEMTCYGTTVVKGVRRWKSKVLALRENYFQTPTSHGMGHGRLCALFPSNYY